MKKGFGRFLSEKFDVPLESISNEPDAHLVGNFVLNIDGCVGIKKYELDEIILRTKGYLLFVSGKSLTMLTFSQGHVCIRGTINGYRIERVG